MTPIKIASAALAAFSAILWLASALVRTPEKIDDLYTVMAIGASGKGYSYKLQELARALKRQSRWSAAAAICTALATGLQAIDLFFSIR